MKKIKIIEIIATLFYIIAAAYYFTVGFYTKNCDKICIAI